MKTMKSLIGISYKELFETLPGHYIVVANDEAMTIVELNKAAETMAKRKKSDCIGKPFEEIYPDRPSSAKSTTGQRRLPETLRTCFQTGQTQGIGRQRYDSIDKHGELVRRMWDVVVYPILKHDKVLGAVISAHDMTDIYDNDEFLNGRLEYLEHLVASNKSKDEFISIASHQLRTPATGVKQYIGMLREGFFGELSADQASIIEKAYESNERQLHIVNDLLKVAQVDDGRIVLNLMKINLNTIVADIIAELNGTFASHNQTLTYTPLEQPAWALADVDTIRMVLENIIDNASKYTPKGRTIDVTVCEKTFDSSSYIVVEVADRGVGIAKADEHRLFKKFSRLPNELSTTVGGTGLGLYWARKIMLLHGGDIEYHHRKGGGSVFSIKLPSRY